MKRTEVFSVPLGALARLDAVRLVGDHKYLIVFCRMGAIQERQVVHLNDDDAARFGAFLQGVPRSPFVPEAVPEEISESEITDTVIAEDEPTKVGG